MAQSKAKQTKAAEPETWKEAEEQLSIVQTDQFWNMNVKLQKKKNSLRKSLNGKIDETSTLTEPQAKKLFTELFADAGLELKFEVSNFEAYTGETNHITGRILHFDFVLYDIETGFSECTSVAVEGSDKGSRAGHKTYWEALKQYLSITFLVTLEEDIEDESFYKSEIKATISQIAELKKIYTGDNLTKLLSIHKIDKIEDLPFDTATSLLEQIKKGDR